MEKLNHVRKRVVGKKVVSVSDGGSQLTLDDGTVLNLFMSEHDCCASASGTWKILDADRLDAVITDVQFEQRKDREYDGEGHESTATITVLHNQNKIALAECYADDGNGGYYYSALSLNVMVPKKLDLVAKVIEA